MPSGNTCSHLGWAFPPLLSYTFPHWPPCALPLTLLIPGPGPGRPAGGARAGPGAAGGAGPAGAAGAPGPPPPSSSISASVPGGTAAPGPAPLTGPGPPPEVKKTKKKQGAKFHFGAQNVIIVIQPTTRRDFWSSFHNKNVCQKFKKKVKKKNQHNKFRL